MRSHVSRKRQICDSLESLCAPDRLLTDPHLCALMAGHGCNALPLQVILSMNPFLKMNVGEFEAQDASQMSRMVLIRRRAEQGMVILPGYTINPEVLFIRDASKSGTVDDVKKFVRAMIGGSRFELYAVGDGTDYCLRIPDPYQIFAFWRSVKYVPFRGCKMILEMYSPELCRVKQPQPAPTMRATSPAHRGRAKHTNDRRRSSSQTNTRKKPPKRNRQQEKLVFDEVSFPKLASI